MPQWASQWNDEDVPNEVQAGPHQGQSATRTNEE